MKHPIAICLGLILLAVGWAGYAPAADGQEPGTALGAVLPDQVIEPSDRDCAILNICTGKDPLHLTDLPGRFLLIEGFSMYCPHCQAAAGDVNALYQALLDSKHADQMTMVGLGAGNSRFEVDFFQEQFDVPFALLPDPDMAFYACLDEPGTPFFLVLENESGTLRLRFEHEGPFDDPQAFLEQIFNAVGLTP